MTKSEDRRSYFNKARHDHGMNHGFNSRGLAPAYLGADTLPQGISDIHWAMHGVQDQMDEMNQIVNNIDDNISDIADDLVDEVIDKIDDMIIGSDSVLSNYSGYISKLLTTRTRIFSDSFGPETAMDISGRIRGYTSNYSWIQYSDKSLTCQDDYDKVIDFNYVTNHGDADGKQTNWVAKSKIVLPGYGYIKRMFITQHNENIVLYYILTNSIPTETGDVADDDVFGYQERWAEYRYHPALITGRFRSTAASTLDSWHLAQRFMSRPLLNNAFINEDPPIARVSAVNTSL